MIRTPYLLTVAAIAMALALPLDAQAQKAGAGKRIYCWDEGGKRVCGDALPAEAAGAARDEINARTGLTTRRVDRALTADERAALAEQQLTQEQQQILQGDRARRAQAMVSSYDSAEAIKKGYDQRIALAKVRMASTENGIKQNYPHLIRLLRAAGNVELEGEKVPPKQVEEIMEARSAIVAMRRQVEVQAKEIDQIERERDEAVALYLEFTQAAASADGTTP